jgi:hypothetical protein
MREPAAHFGSTDGRTKGGGRLSQWKREGRDGGRYGNYERGGSGRWPWHGHDGRGWRTVLAGDVGSNWHAGHGHSNGSTGFKLIQTDSKISNGFKPFKVHSIQKGPSELRKYEIKYGFEWFDERNNFLHRNVFRFKVDFEWKFIQASRFEIQ